jgi:hypothetical protein
MTPLRQLLSSDIQFYIVISPVSSSVSSTFPLMNLDRRLSFSSIRPPVREFLYVFARTTSLLLSISSVLMVTEEKRVQVLFARFSETIAM